MSWTQDDWKRLLMWLGATADRELDCDEFLARVGPLAELLAAARSPSEEHQLLVQHLSVCPECREEFEALIAVLRGEG